MTKKFIIISSVLIVAVAPAIALGWSSFQYEKDFRASTPTTEATLATKEELLRIAASESKHTHIDQGSEDLRITEVSSFKHLHKWWYIVMVKYANYGKVSPNPAPMLIAKYYNGEGGSQVVTDPGEQLPLYNISDSQGIPYNVIDEYNNALLESEPETEED